MTTHGKFSFLIWKNLTSSDCKLFQKYLLTNLIILIEEFDINLFLSIPHPHIHLFQIFILHLPCFSLMKRKFWGKLSVWGLFSILEIYDGGSRFSFMREELFLKKYYEGYSKKNFLSRWPSAFMESENSKYFHMYFSLQVETESDRKNLFFHLIPRGWFVTFYLMCFGLIFMLTKL